VKQANAISDSPLHKLGLQDFLSALFLIGSQYEGFTDTKGKHIGPSKKNLEVHRILCKSLTAFEDWPESFYTFLDHLRKEGQNSRRNWGIQRDFDKFDHALYDQLTSREFDFMRTAFEEYLIHRWDGGCASGIARIRKAAQQNSKYMPREEAKTILGISNEPIDVYLSRGKLKGIVRKHDGVRNYLIERSSVVELKRELDEALYLKQVAPILGLYTTRVLELVEADLLDLISGPELDGYGDWLFSGKSVEGLLEKLKKKIVKLPRTRTKKTVSFNTAIRRLANVGVRLPQFISAILDGTVSPCAENKKLKGLRRLLFPELELSDYIWSHVRESAKDGFLVSELPDILGLTRNAAYSLVRKGILPAWQKTEDPSPKLFVTKEDFNSFVTSHVVLSKIASKLKTDAGFLARLLMKKGLKPVSGQMMDGGQRYVFKKSDLESVDLARLVAAARKQSALRRKEPQTIGLDDAAKILDIDIETLRQLVENGVLTTYKNGSRNKGLNDEMNFSAFTIKKYRSRIKDYIGLVTYKVAAKMTGLSVNGLWTTYVQKGRLHAINPKGKSKPHYFKKETVEALAIIRRQTITSPKVAMKLGVNITCVHKMKLAGILKPVSGPDVDGFRLDLYLRSDIEKLRAEREAFKAKRVKEGGTARFGRQAGPKASPVQDIIGPRIDQLIEKWHERRPDQHITGERLYQQLIKEGYQTGINTVYMYLRQKQRQAA
jgi:DNA-binding CsgD family transcriptional regulator